MQFHPTPFKFGVFQLLVACSVVIFLTSPIEAMGGPMLVIKGGHGHGGGGGGAGAILAAGLVVKLLQHLKKKHGGFSGGGYEGGHGYSLGGGEEGHGYSGGGGGGHGFSIAGYSLGGGDDHGGHMGGYGEHMGGGGYMAGGGHMGGYGGGDMGGYGGGRMGGHIGGLIGGYSFESHDKHLPDYGYEPQGYAWAK